MLYRRILIGLQIKPVLTQNLSYSSITQDIYPILPTLYSIMEPSFLISEQAEPQRVTLNLSLLDTVDAQPIFDCLIILNYKFEPWLLKRLVDKAKVVVVTDGGANTLYQSQFRDISNLYGIVGDLDSINPEVKAYYQHKNVQVIQDQNQDSNDFQKAVILAHHLKLRSIVSLGTLGGRIDQQLCNLSVIERYSQLHAQRFVAFGKTSLMFLIRGEEQAHVKVGKCCVLHQAGMVCFGKTKVDTQGFKWNLTSEGPELQWPKLVSSSNVIEGNQVKIRSQHQLFFTISFKNTEVQKLQ